LTTRAVVDALAADGAPRVLANASGLDIYGAREDPGDEAPGRGRGVLAATASGIAIYGAREDPVDEASGPGQGFLPDTAVAWEREAMRAADHGVRVVLVRSGLVLAPEAEALIRMARPVKLFAGGPLGSGR